LIAGPIPRRFLHEKTASQVRKIIPQTKRIVRSGFFIIKF
jgi:hypothetical protein